MLTFSLHFNKWTSNSSQQSLCDKQLVITYRLPPLNDMSSTDESSNECVSRYRLEYNFNLEVLTNYIVMDLNLDLLNFFLSFL